MRVRLANKVAIVTGGATGIGKAICLAMAAEGARVVIDYRATAAPAEEVAEAIQNSGGRALALQGDVTRPGEVDRLVAQTAREFGHLDILVNNAGIEERHPFLETPFEVFSKVIAVNLTGAWLCSQAAARQMVRQGRGGRIINISSVHEDLTMPTNSPYCAAKGGLRMLMRTIAIELAPHGITVNNICPGAVDTPMNASTSQNPRKMKALLDEIPLGRMAKPGEIAELSVFLASEAAAYVTASSYFIDGGLTRNSGTL